MDAGWKWAIAIAILLPLILVALVASLKRENPMLIRNRDANRFNPGCFKVGGDCK